MKERSVSCIVFKRATTPGRCSGCGFEGERCAATPGHSGQPHPDAASPASQVDALDVYALAVLNDLIPDEDRSGAVGT